MNPMVRHSRAIIAVALSLLLAACPAPRRPPPPAEAQEPTLRPAPGSQLYAVDSKASLARILVFRGGTLGQAGHNHVIASHDLQGKVYLAIDLKRTAFELTLPVHSLTVDEAQLRKEEGADFPPEVPEGARQGTRRNMLGAALLDGERYPVIKLIGAKASGAGERFKIDVSVGIKGQWHDVVVPVQLQKEGERLTATGEFALTHAQLGLQPFSIMLGAVKVQDEMQVKFRIVAVSSR